MILRSRPYGFFKYLLQIMREDKTDQPCQMPDSQNYGNGPGHPGIVQPSAGKIFFAYQPDNLHNQSTGKEEDKYRPEKMEFQAFHPCSPIEGYHGFDHATAGTWQSGQHFKRTE